MKLFRSTAVIFALIASMLAMPVMAEMAQQHASGDPIYTANAPKGYSMIGDLLIARPLLIAATVVGAAVFVVTLPFSALGGNIAEAAQSLIQEPGQAAFQRCLGCTTVGYKGYDND